MEKILSPNECVPPGTPITYVLIKISSHTSSSVVSSVVGLPEKNSRVEGGRRLPSGVEKNSRPDGKKTLDAILPGGKKTLDIIRPEGELRLPPGVEYRGSWNTDGSGGGLGVAQTPALPPTGVVENYQDEQPNRVVFVSRSRRLAAKAPGDHIFLTRQVRESGKGNNVHQRARAILEQWEIAEWRFDLAELALVEEKDGGGYLNELITQTSGLLERAHRAYSDAASKEEAAPASKVCRLGYDEARKSVGGVAHEIYSDGDLEDLWRFAVEALKDAFYGCNLTRIILDNYGDQFRMKVEEVVSRGGDHDHVAGRKRATSSLAEQQHRGRASALPTDSSKKRKLSTGGKSIGGAASHVAADPGNVDGEFSSDWDSCCMPFAGLALEEVGTASTSSAEGGHRDVGGGGSSIRRPGAKSKTEAGNFVGSAGSSSAVAPIKPSPKAAGVLPPLGGSSAFGMANSLRRQAIVREVSDTGYTLSMLAPDGRDHRYNLTGAQILGHFRPCPPQKENFGEILGQLLSIASEREKLYVLLQRAQVRLLHHLALGAVLSDPQAGDSVLANAAVEYYFLCSASPLVDVDDDDRLRFQAVECAKQKIISEGHEITSAQHALKYILKRKTEKDFAEKDGESSGPAGSSAKKMYSGGVDTKTKTNDPLAFTTSNKLPAALNTAESEGKQPGGSEEETLDKIRSAAIKLSPQNFLQLMGPSLLRMRELVKKPVVVARTGGSTKEQ